MRADGSVIIDTKILDDGMEKGFEELKNEVSSVGTAADEVKQKIKSAFSEVDVSRPISEARNKLQALESELAAITAEHKFAIAEDDDAGAERLGKKMTAVYNRVERARERLSREIEKEAAKQATAEEKAAKRKEAADKKAADNAIKQAEREARAEEKAREQEWRGATKGARRFGTRMREIVSGALFFNIISSGLRGITSYFGDALQTSEEYRNSVAKLKGALLTAFQPIYEFVLPAVVSFINYLTAATQRVIRFFSSLTGKSTESMAKSAQEMYSAVESMNESGKSADKAGDSVEEVGKKAKKTGKEIKKASRELMGFDELNKLSDKSEEGIFDDYDVPEYKKPEIEKIEDVMSDSIAPEFGEFDFSQYEAVLAEIEFLLADFVFAIGAILTFSGANIPLGIAMMAAGALMKWDAISANWSAVQDMLQGPIGEVYAIVSTAFLVIGAILLFSGCTPANIVTGLALIAMGAAGLVATAGANWGWTKDQVSASIALVFAVVSVAFLVIGAILVFSGAQTVLGIGLLAAGAVGLAATVGLNWESMNQALEGPVGVVFALISGALLVLGAILAFSGANLLVGIGLIAAGAVGLIATAKKLKWDTIENTLKGPIGAVTAVVSAALLAIGAIIAFSGAGLPLGIALIATGAAGLVTTTILNWNTVKDKIKPVLSGITAIASASALALGIILCLSGAGIALGLPLIAMGISGSVTAWNLNDNPLTRFVKNLANGIIKIINRITQAINDVFHIKFPGLRINGKEIIPRYEARLMNIPQIPLLAKGAVIPPNAPFLATLGDQRHGNNIEAPEDLIRKIVREESGGNSETIAILRAILLAIQETGNTRISINGRDVFQAIVEENARSILRNGSSPLKV